MSHALSDPKEIFRFDWRIPLTFSLTLCAALLAAESVLRVYVPAPMIGGYVDSCENAERFGWGFPPRRATRGRDPDSGKHYFRERTNSRGWKDVEHSFTKPEGTVRILIVGDSYTFGIPPIEDVYGRVLERLLREHGYSVETISIGVPGWATDQEHQAYLQEGRFYSPDIVISQFCVNDVYGNAGFDNDYDTSLKPFIYTLKEGRLQIRKIARPRPQESVLAHLRRTLLLHSRIYLCIEGICSPSRKEPTPEKEDELWFLQNKPLAGGEWTLGEERPDVTERWDLYAAVLAEWKRDCERQGALFFAFNESFDPGFLEFYLHWDLLREEDGRYFARTVEGGWGEIDFTRPRRRHAVTCESVGVELVPQKRTYSRYQRDPHTNAEGNIAMARDIAEFLLSHPEASKILAARPLAESIVETDLTPNRSQEDLWSADGSDLSPTPGRTRPGERS